MAETSGVLHSLIGDLGAYIKDLKMANDPAKLRATVKNFSAFIDDVALALLAKKDKGLDLKDTMFLAKCYASLEEYAKAANLYAKIPPPKFLDKDNLKEEEEKRSLPTGTCKSNTPKPCGCRLTARRNSARPRRYWITCSGTKTPGCRFMGKWSKFTSWRIAANSALPSMAWP